MDSKKKLEKIVMSGTALENAGTNFAPVKFMISFADDKGAITIVSIPSKEVHTLANAFYNYLLDLGIEGVTIETEGENKETDNVKG